MDQVTFDSLEKCIETVSYQVLEGYERVFEVVQRQ